MSAFVYGTETNDEERCVFVLGCALPEDEPSRDVTRSSRIIGIDDTYVEIETTELRAGFPEPFIAVVKIEHNGKPEETAKGYHDLISEG
jgi:hypothetical protein